MDTIKEKIEKLDKAIASPATPKEFISDLKKTKASLEAELEAKEKQDELEAKYKAEKKAKIRKQIGRKVSKRIKRKVKAQRKVKGKPTIKEVKVAKAVKRGKKKAKGFKLPKYVKRFNTGRDSSDIKRDSKRIAMAPGKHKQKPGSKHKFYYENRANRTDISPKRHRLATGGFLSMGRSKAALNKDHKYFNESEAHEVRYAKDAERKKVGYKAKGGSLYAKGGELRHVRVTYSNGDVIDTAMAAHLTDSEIRDYFKKGKSFNIGSGERDNIQQVELVEIIHKKGGSLYAKGGVCGCPMGYVVTAFDKNKGYRVNLTIPQSKKKSELVADNYKKDMAVAIDKYKVFSDIKVEKSKYPIGTKYSKGGYMKGGSLYKKGGKPHPEKVGKVMREFKAGKLKSHGKKVTDRDQAIAIALSEANLSNKK